MDEGFAAAVTITVKPEELERFKVKAKAVTDAMSKEKEFKHAWIHTHADDPNTFFAYEAWSCTLDFFMKELRNKPYRHQYEAELESMTVGERSIVILDYFASYPGRSPSHETIE